jgi:hypothetical protein
MEAYEITLLSVCVCPSFCVSLLNFLYAYEAYEIILLSVDPPYFF